MTISKSRSGKYPFASLFHGGDIRPKGTQITEYPKGFKDWVKDNAENIAQSCRRGTEPYFVRNNALAIDNILNPKQKRLTTLEKAKLRHEARTPEQMEKIKRTAWDRQLRMNMPQLTEDERTALAGNWLEMEKALGIKKGRMMTVEEADKQAANPRHGQVKSIPLTAKRAALLTCFAYQVLM